MLLENPSDIQHQIILRSPPIRCDQESERRLSEHPLNDDVFVEPLNELTKQVQVFFVAKYAKRPARVFCGQGGASDDVQVMDLQRVDTDPGHLIRHCQPLLARFPGKTKNQVCADMDGPASCHLHSA